MRLYDAHNHLQSERLPGERAAVLAACGAAGVAAMVVNGSCEDDWEAVDRLAEAHPGRVIPAFGLHPWYVAERGGGWLEALRSRLDRRRAAVGEIGLDRWKRGLPWEGQLSVFEAQMRLAAERNLPACVHCLQAWGPLVDALERGPRPECGFLVHSFGGSLEVAERLAPLGAYFSLPGYFAEARKERQREVFRRLPPDRLLIETDAPDQPLPAGRETHPAADPATGERVNHPANLGAVYAFAAQLLGEPLDALAARVERNFLRLFGGVAA